MVKNTKTNKIIFGVAVVIILLFSLWIINLGKNKEFEVDTKAQVSTESFSINPLFDEEERTIEYSLIAQESKKYYSGDYFTKAYSYNGMNPGPILRAKVGDTLKVQLDNKLPEATTIHWHGLQLMNPQDGVPDVTQEPVMPGESFNYEFELKNSGIYWYHPHINTPEQVEKGLYGALIVDNPKIKIPNDEDYLFFLDDIRISRNGDIGEFGAGHMDIMHGRYGNVLMVNGMMNPEFNSEIGNIVRLRIVNSANARTFVLGFTGGDFLVIGEDIGLVEESYRTKYLAVSSGERYDVLFYLKPGVERYDIYNYNARGSQTLARINVLNTSDNIEDNYKEFMQFNSKKLREDYPNWDYALNMDANFTMLLEGIVDESRTLHWTINKRTHPENNEVLQLEEGKFYKIRYVNTQNQPHPMHLHGQKFLVLSRNGVPEERKAWKDTVLVSSRETVEIGFVAEGKGSWVNHCHILEHAEAGMLNVVEIV